jgi:tRNA (guanine-N7-)-methyltransferase
VRSAHRDITQFQDFVLFPDADVPGMHVPETYGNTNPLEVDIGSGKGRFLLARAAKAPNTNFLGIERQLGRVYRAAKKSHHRNLTNVRVCHIEATLALAELLQDESVATFYIFFPDPWPKRRHEGRRLVKPAFLDLLHAKLANGGSIHFASDHLDYADAVADCFSNDKRFGPTEPFQPTEDELTDFELIFTAQNKPTNRHSIQKR